VAGGGLAGGPGLAPLLLRPRRPPRGALRSPVRRAGRRLAVGPRVAPVALLAVLGLAPLVVTRQDWLNLGVVYFLTVALAQSWNVIGGLTGQVNLGHAAFFGLGALATRQLWVSGTPVLAAALAGGRPRGRRRRRGGSRGVPAARRLLRGGHAGPGRGAADRRRQRPSRDLDAPLGGDRELSARPPLLCRGRARRGDDPRGVRPGRL